VLLLVLLAAAGQPRAGLQLATAGCRAKVFLLVLLAATGPPRLRLQMAGCRAKVLPRPRLRLAKLAGCKAKALRMVLLAAAGTPTPPHPRLQLATAGCRAKAHRLATAGGVHRMLVTAGKDGTPSCSAF
ncbi:MAG: hypothetical protein GY772_20525, partial [bacterium]|nr:hypothetical protein [bacterium]